MPSPIMEVRMDKPICPYCKGNNIEYKGMKEYKKKFFLYGYYCNDCLKSFDLVFPKTKEEI